MSSPFSTLEEFNGAIDGPTGGAIYTFAGSPAINAIALLVAVGIFFWFMVKTYSTAHHETSSVDRSMSQLSSFIVAGLLSLVAADQLQQPPVREQAHRSAPRASLVSTARRAPLALLGMIGVALPARRTKRRRYRPTRSSRR